jgi:hypothetical protein
MNEEPQEPRLGMRGGGLLCKFMRPLACHRIELIVMQWICTFT